MEERHGRIAEIVYHNEETYYTVAVVEDDEAMEQFIAVGSLPIAERGMSFAFYGEWKIHSLYGEQFAFTDYREELPQTVDGIREFLASGVIKGIGKKTAAAIVAKFGEETLSVLEFNPERLLSVSGIGEKTASAIAEAFRSHKEFAEIAMFFQEYGISANYAMKMYKIYAELTIPAVVENPYRLVTDVVGIGFKKADEIASRLGIKKDSEFRLTSGIRYALWTHINEGHTFVPLKPFCEEVGGFLDVTSSDIRDMLVQMTIDGYVQVEELEQRHVVYLLPYYEAENNVCRKLMALHDAQLTPIKANVDEQILIAQRESGISLSDNQKEAVRAAATNGVCVITGGPGTGKTTIINTIIRVFEGSGLKVGIAAPTGRAAKRITETSGHFASTVHRLLEYFYSENEERMNFGKNQESPLDFDVVIIDEMSMVDIMLMDGLLKAIRQGTRLILVGDADQLPSVGAGNVLRDMIGSEALNCVELTDIFRQAKESMIVVNAHRINRGEYPFLNEKEKDFFLLRKNGEKAMLETIKELCLTRLPNFYQDCDPIQDIQVITPVRKGIIGTHNMNKELQRILNPLKAGMKEKTLKDRVFREGDKVMQIKNNYQMEWKRMDDFTDGQGVFNGDVGYIHSVDTEENKINVLYDDVRFVSYDFIQTDELELAYAMTVHKSQGSEFPIIVMPISWFPPMLATRNLLYTGITRGKQVVVLVGSQSHLEAMIDNNRIVERYSGLGLKLKRFLAIEE